MSHPKLTNILTSIVSPNVKTMQSMFFVKAPGKPGQAWHQDEIFIPTRDKSLVGAWIALDDATIDNGCLFIHPGSHKEGILHPMKPHTESVHIYYPYHQRVVVCVVFCSTASLAADH